MDLLASDPGLVLGDIDEALGLLVVFLERLLTALLLAALLA